MKVKKLILIFMFYVIFTSFGPKITTGWMLVFDVIAAFALISIISLMLRKDT